MKIIECVPNFSEGRDSRKIAAIARVFKSFPGVRLVDFSGDADHNRSVFTFLGKPEDVLEAALAASGKALELIDMREQAGVHPRLGAVDVVPFIPLGKTKMQDAVDLAHTFGRELYERFGVPVYFYGHAALVPGRKELADVRHGGYEALQSKMINPGDAPDVGKPEFNARTGATVVGARVPLVAYNINLISDDLRLARNIASQIREKNGGLQHVRAIGVILKSRGIAQISMNLTNCKETPFKIIYDQVERLAAERGVEILESELIGLVPKCAFAGTKPEYLKLKGFDKDRLLETHLKTLTD
ncbi:MAG: glutamate formimidoyltransferase [Deltaproteobacteria bacterium HGW-Deltaproteobacteria-13]|jgi:glutamate formiminotransferase|nr:MAG: glutamate formimidoyltransferase [Deltaproteobacteria bacterium HGW-Deltaproteobacteria-13]